MSAVTEILGILSALCLAGGGGVAAWGLVGVGMALNQHQGSEIQSGFMKVIGGAAVGAAGGIFLGISDSLPAAALISSIFFK